MANPPHRCAMAALPELNNDVTALILLRLPPDDPSCLVRAALVCKPWRRILSDPAFPFPRRYREFHHTPPLLGYLPNFFSIDPIPRFISIADASPFSSPEFDCYKWWTLDCRHGRVLFRCVKPTGLVVWDPITGDKHYITTPKFGSENPNFGAAVLCAADGCDHLHCHSGPFLIVYVISNRHGFSTLASVYSSVTGAWSNTYIYPDVPHIYPAPCLLAGDALYFIANARRSLVKYDLVLQDISVINMPEECILMIDTIAISEGGALGFAKHEDYKLLLWSWQSVSDGIEDWVQHRVIDLKTLFANPIPPYIRIAGFAESAEAIFMYADGCIFAFELSSGQVRKVRKSRYGRIVPFISFYTPDLADVILPQS